MDHGGWWTLCKKGRDLCDEVAQDFVEEVRGFGGRNQEDLMGRVERCGRQRRKG